MVEVMMVLVWLWGGDPQNGHGEEGGEGRMGFLGWKEDGLGLGVGSRVE